jgi:hypothetical protein
VAVKPKAKKPKKLTRGQLAAITSIELRERYSHHCLFFDMSDECMETPLPESVYPALAPGRPMSAGFATPCILHEPVVRAAYERLVPEDSWLTSGAPPVEAFHAWVLENFPRLREMIDADHNLWLHGDIGMTEGVKKILEERRAQQKIETEACHGFT